MTPRGGNVSLRVKVKPTDTVAGNAQTRPGWAGRKGRRAGKRPQGTAKGLTLTERRLSFAFVEGTPRPEGQAFRRPRGGPMEAALNFCLLFFQEKRKIGRSQKEHNKQAAGIDPSSPTFRRRYDMLAGTAYPWTLGMGTPMPCAAFMFPVSKHLEDCPSLRGETTKQSRSTAALKRVQPTH